METIRTPQKFGLRRGMVEIPTVKNFNPVGVWFAVYVIVAVLMRFSMSDDRVTSSFKARTKIRQVFFVNVLQKFSRPCEVKWGSVGVRTS